MSEHPILFNAEMVKAILDGRKTQTRRVVKWESRGGDIDPHGHHYDLGFYFSGLPSSGWVLRSRDGMGTWNDRTHPIHCPYGVPGDRLWVQETCRPFGFAGNMLIEYKARSGNLLLKTHWDEERKEHYQTQQEWTWYHKYMISGWCRSSHMPRWASRINLEVANIRVERVSDISIEDAKAEGVTPVGVKGDSRRWRGGFRDLWDSSINAKRGFSWSSNPWVWVVEFKRIING